MDIQYSKSAVKAVNAMDKPTKERIKAGIEGLTKSPPEGDIKILAGYRDARYRLRVGRYRVIYNYRVDKSIEILYIMNIGSRGDIYK